jgi:uncharacterized protein
MSVPVPTAPIERLDPVAAADRVALLDVLRGFALYGVLLANTFWFSGRAFLPREEIAATRTRINEVASFLIKIFVDGKAMTLFSLLFGLGFAIQLERARARGQDGLPVYLRRLGILLAIGLCHIVLIWWGDILWNYALTGFVMVLFRRRSQRALLVWAALFVVVPPMIAMVPAVAAFFERVIPQPPDGAAFRAQVLDALRGHDRARLIEMQVRQTLHHVSHMPLSFIPWTLSRFLAGYALGRSRLLHDAASRRPLFRKVLVGGLIVGLACGVAGYLRQRFVRNGGTLSVGVKIALIVPDELAYIAMAAAYVAALALLMQRPAWSRRLLVLAPVGQMALTSYLSQSLICTFLFYGWGLGLIGHVGTALCIPLTLAIFTFQILVSRAWLRRFRFGPVEWVWRSLTYGKRQPMRRPEPT